MRKFFCTVIMLSLVFMFIGGVAVVHVNCSNTLSEEVIYTAELTRLPDGSVDIEIAGNHLQIAGDISESAESAAGFLYALCPESVKSAVEAVLRLPTAADLLRRNSG